MTKHLRNEALRRGCGLVRRTREIGSYRSNNRSTDVVYILRWPDNLIKVGISGRSPGRVKEWRCQCKMHGETCFVLAMVNGTRKEEQAILKYFHELRSERNGELLRAEPRLIRYIRWLRNQFYVEVEEDFGENVPTDVEIVDSSGWVPTPERSTAPVGGGPIFELCGYAGDENHLGERVLRGDDYYTPVNLIETVQNFYDGIDLDPASHSVANRVVRANKFFGTSENGLLQKWQGRVWLNPPFEKWPEFALKLVDSLDDTEEIIALCSLPSLSTGYMRPCLDRLNCICIIAGRPVFWGPQVVPGDVAPAGYALLYYGQRGELFAEAFSQHGIVLSPTRQPTVIDESMEA
jgi:hypothetical protein